MAIIMSPEDISKEACGQPREPGILFWNQAENWKDCICTTDNDIVGLLVFLDLRPPGWRGRRMNVSGHRRGDQVVLASLFPSKTCHEVSVAWGS